MSSTYDYIIIGAGSAGCVLANRLSANRKNSVLLIEAGGPDSKREIHIPAAYSKLHRTEVDWQLRTAPQKDVLYREIYLPRGKVLGGCSSTNAMAYVRGNKEDYNDWAALGNVGWDYESVLPYFIKSEDNQDIKNEFHGRKGELNVEFSKRFNTPYGAAFIDACVEKGFERNDDYNGEKQEGAGLFQFTTRKGKRHSGVGAFLKKAMKRKNLKVLTHTHVQKILIENNKATGVNVFGKGGKGSFYANKEIILSAGAFASPQLLMLSGIGNKTKLFEFDIDCIHDLKGVGENLQDHLFYPIAAISKQEWGLNHHLSPFQQIYDLARYLLQGKGVLNVGPLESVAFGKSSMSPDRVDYQFHFCPIQFGENPEEIDVYNLETYPYKDGFTILPTLLRPKSRGFVSLRSRDPLAPPIIQPNFLSEEEDVKLLLEAGRKAIEIMNAEAFDPYRARMTLLDKDCSDAELLEHMKSVIETVYHPVGTCKMGNDEMAVVDDQLRVKGIDGLRVIDASIMPTIVSGNTNAPVYMIAEKGADMILKNAQ